MHGEGEISLWLAAPFALLLLSIAVLPLAAHHWWESNRNRGIVAAILGLPIAGWCLFSGRSHDLVHALWEYQQFVVLLGSLFVVAGGIFVDCDFRATPKVNAAFLALGAVLASAIGTTGASMLLIRPLLHTNSERTRTVHTVIFFIFVVSNCGGLLTPLGDPPLFMGYLRGIPFEWTLRFWPEWLGVNAALIGIYAAWDRHQIRHETERALRLDREHLEPLRIRGGFNFVFLAGIVASVAFLGKQPFLRDGIMVACAVASLVFTKKDLRVRNGFQWAPIVEVAVLFAGIFVTMVPAMLWLQANGSELGVDTPGKFFWATGSLSAFLDNAPTYLTFTTVAASRLQSLHPDLAVDAGRLDTLLQPGVPEGQLMLIAISLGAVFMGAMTYIGNGPNFMVKSIADSSGVRMPSFFGYLLYSVCVLVPVLVVMSLIVF